MMIDPERLLAFAIVTGVTSLVPGPQMIFLLTQTLWRGARSGVTALIGMQLGNATWFVLAGLGLGTLAKSAPHVFTALTLAGALYLGWLGLKALRRAGEGPTDEQPARTASANAFRDSIVVALSNPKSLVYVLALLPPFVDARLPVTPQLVVLAAIAIGCDCAVGIAYILAGNGLAQRMRQPRVRLWLDRGVGALFLLLAVAVIASVIGDLAR